MSRATNDRLLTQEKSQFLQLESNYKNYRLLLETAPSYVMSNPSKMRKTRNLRYRQRNASSRY